MQHIKNIVIVYPFPMHLSQGYTYHLSILQFLCALAKVTEVHLLSLDSKNQISNILMKQFGWERPKNLRIQTIRNTYFGVKSNSIFFRASVLKRLKRIIATNDRVAVMTRNVKIASFLFPHKICRNEKVCRIFECHQIYSINLAIERQFGQAQKERSLEDKLYNNVNIVFCNTSLIGKILTREYAVRTTVLPVAVKDLDIFDLADESQVSEKSYDFIYSGTFSPWKGVDTFLDSLQLLKSQGWNGCALLVGLTPQQMQGWRIKLKVAELESNVTLIGRTPQKNIRGLLDKAKVGVIPNMLADDSILGTSPLKLYEYAARGLSVVATRIPALISEIQIPNVHWAEPEDPQTLAQKLDLALSQWHGIDTANIQWAASYTWSNRARLVLDQIEQEFSE